MFDRFSDRARNCMKFATQEAHAQRHDYIGTEHILLGILRSDGVATNVLENLDVDLGKVRERMVGKLKPQDDYIALGNLPFTPRAKKVLELAMNESCVRGDGYVGTEHLLLGLALEGEGLAAVTLKECGVEYEQLKSEINEFLGCEENIKKTAEKNPSLAQPLSAILQAKMCWHKVQIAEHEKSIAEIKDLLTKVKPCT